VFSVILALRKNAMPADASAAAITLPPQPAWRGSVLTAVGSRVLRLVLWHAWCCGASAQRRAWHSGALGTAAHLAQRHAWHSGALGTAARLVLWCVWKN